MANSVQQFEFSYQIITDNIATTVEKRKVTEIFGHTIFRKNLKSALGSKFIAAATKKVRGKAIFVNF